MFHQFQINWCLGSFLWVHNSALSFLCFVLAELYAIYYYDYFFDKQALID